MTLPLNPRLTATDPPPVMEARRWIEGKVFTQDRPLLNVSQAAPVDSPPLPLREALAEAALNDPAAHLYGPVLGLPALRQELAAHFARTGAGRVTASQVAITQGCNQAFCAAISAVASAGDEVILPVPWYFNHRMWLDMNGITCLPLQTGADLIPDPQAAAALITAKTRAIVLVTPNNPGGVEYPPAVLSAFRDLARARGISLIIDETYRDFDSRWSPATSGQAHDLLSDPAWDEQLICLYSFSKAYRLTGHRVGALIASPAIIAQAEKFLDTVAICPAQLGQIGALWGMRNLGPWLEGERQEILSRRQAMIEGFAALDGWKLMGCGAYFAWAEHPYAISAEQLCKRLVDDCAVLILPGSYFAPAETRTAERQLRIAFANIGRAEIAELFRRLAAFRL